MNNIIKDLPILSKKGHSRIVYDYGDKVIKVAKSQDGCIGNFKEKFLYDFFSKFYNFRIFPTVYEISDDSKYMMVDKCDPITKEEFDHIYPYMLSGKPITDLSGNEFDFVANFSIVSINGININVERHDNIGKLNGEYKILDAGRWSQYRILPKKDN